MRYENVVWTRIDAGRESYWAGAIWKHALGIFARYDGSIYNDANSPLHTALAAEIPELKWSSGSETDFHSVFRDYRQAWTLTGVVDVAGGSVSSNQSRPSGLGRL